MGVLASAMRRHADNLVGGRRRASMENPLPNRSQYPVHGPKHAGHFPIWKEKAVSEVRKPIEFDTSESPYFLFHFVTFRLQNRIHYL
jgi:hypothetical protein